MKIDHIYSISLYLQVSILYSAAYALESMSAIDSAREVVPYQVGPSEVYQWAIHWLPNAPLSLPDLTNFQKCSAPLGDLSSRSLMLTLTSHHCVHLHLPYVNSQTYLEEYPWR